MSNTATYKIVSKHTQGQIVCGRSVVSGSYFIVHRSSLNIAFQPGGFDNWSWSEFGKSVAIGAVSGALTAGIGTGIAALGGATGMVGTEAGRLGLELIRAGAHGAAQGGLSVLQGGSFGSGFLSGALGSLGGSAFRSVGGDFAKSFWGVATFSALAGGVGSKLGGGSFWQGFATGGIVGAANHGLNQLANGAEDKIRNKMLNRRFASMMLKKINASYERGIGVGKGPNAFDCSGAVVDGINKTLGNNAIDINNTNANSLFTKYSTTSTNSLGSVQFYDYTNDSNIDHVTTYVNGTVEMLHSSESAGKSIIVPSNYLNNLDSRQMIYQRDVNWNFLLNR